jgi:GntR family transcriptional regulator
MIQLNYRDSRPIYEQVKDGLRQLIINGVLTEGSRLPSVRELAVSLTINPNTIQRAYRELEAEGYIVSVPGKGSYVSCENDAAGARKAELAEKLSALAAELHRLGVSDEEMRAMIQGGQTDDRSQIPAEEL